jgi:hypothetical protein
MSSVREGHSRSIGLSFHWRSGSLHCLEIEQGRASCIHAESYARTVETDRQTSPWRISIPPLKTPAPTSMSAVDSITMSAPMPE